MCTMMILTANESCFYPESGCKEITLEKLSDSVPGNVLVRYVWPPFLWSCTFLSMVLKDKKRTGFRINLYFDSFLYSQHPG